MKQRPCNATIESSGNGLAVRYDVLCQWGSTAKALYSQVKYCMAMVVCCGVAFSVP